MARAADGARRRSQACFFAHFAPALLETRYVKKLGSYEANKLQPDMPLSVHFAGDSSSVDVDDLTEVIDDVRAEGANRQAPSRDKEDW